MQRLLDILTSMALICFGLLLVIPGAVAILASFSAAFFWLGLLVFLFGAVFVLIGLACIVAAIGRLLR